MEGDELGEVVRRHRVQLSQGILIGLHGPLQVAPDPGRHGLKLQSPAVQGILFPLVDHAPTGVEVLHRPLMLEGHPEVLADQEMQGGKGPRIALLRSRIHRR